MGRTSGYPMPEGREWLKEQFGKLRENISEVRRYAQDNYRLALEALAGAVADANAEYQWRIVGTTAERDARYGVPSTAAERAALANLQPVWFNHDTGREESYFAVTGTVGLIVAGLPAGATPGWYPAGRRNASDLGVFPASIVIGGGSATVGADGTIFLNAVPSISLNDIFDGLGGDAYRIFGAIDASAEVGGDLRMRLRTTGGGDLATGYFGHHQYAVSTGWGAVSFGGSVQNNVTTWSLGYRQYSTFDMVLRRPAIANKATQLMGLIASSGADQVSGRVWGTRSVAEPAYSGISIFPNAAVTISGWVKVVKIA